MNYKRAGLHQHKTGQEGAPASRGPTSGRWSPRTKQLAVRFALLGCAYATWGALFLMMTVYHGSSSYSISTVNGHVTRVAQPGVTVYQENPAPVRIILLLAAGAVLVSTASVLWRVIRHSSKIGVAGMVVGGMAAVMVVLGAFTIGPFFLPLAAVLILLALPITPSSPEHPYVSLEMPAAGWYPDPTRRFVSRWWDGMEWTKHVTSASGPDTDPV